MGGDVRMYKAINGQVAEVKLASGVDADGKPTSTWAITRFLKRTERGKFLACPNCVRPQERMIKG